MVKVRSTDPRKWGRCWVCDRLAGSGYVVGKTPDGSKEIFVCEPCYQEQKRGRR